MRLRSEVFETISDNGLVELEAQDHLNRWELEKLMQQHGVSSANEDNTFHFGEELAGKVYTSLVVLWAVARADLGNTIDNETCIAIGDFPSE
mmetsp:Transcript_11912/g.17073  ORF Transcript_11912/g.17073 Transcript_11912/m.17073 type:complete len:92 (-) Transcript_11912:1529-1804(-)